MIAPGTKALLQNATVIEASQFPIQSVKLFGSGGAEITRRFPISILRSKDEPQIIEITHLPDGLSSIDVSATSTSGNITILDHYHTSVAQDPSEDSTPPNETLRELAAEQLRLEGERRLRQQSLAYLTTYMDSLAQCKSQSQPEAAQMVTFFDEFVELGVLRSRAIAELDVKIAEVGDRIAKEQNRLAKLTRDLPTKVVTVLSCKSDVPVEAAELTVIYVVKQVSWKPAYDLHIAMTGNVPSPIAKLDFRCTVTQWTGENWENVSLALTTADQVSQLVKLPEPKRVDISLSRVFPSRPGLFGMSQDSSAPAPAPSNRSFFGSALQAQVVNTTAQITQAHTHEHSGEQELDSPLQQQPSRLQAWKPAQPPGGVPVPPGIATLPNVDAPSPAVSRLISRDSRDPITHIANGCLFIPSDHVEHRVLVASLSLQAEFMRVAIPNADTRVYYTCEVKNTSECVLLPGTVKTYLNGKHVSSTDIHNTELPQTVECSLAVDTGVKTLQNRAPDAFPSVGGFTGKATTTYTSATVVHNTHKEPIRGIIVRSSVPLPTDPRITVVLKEPAGLAGIDEGSVTVKDGCLARWSTTGGRKGKQVGLFEWVCDVSPGTEVLKAVWEVCAPQELKLSERELC